MAFWFLFLVSEIITIISLTKVHGQRLSPTEGFISIDCGIAGTANYTDPNTNLQYISDEEFVAAGINHNVSSSYVSDGRLKGPGGAIYDAPISLFEKQLQTLRSFPDAPRSCYALKPVTKHRKYIVRMVFLYGNYDGKNRSNITFDIHIDVNYWKTVNITDPRDIHLSEAIAVALRDSISVCLIGTGSGTPFVSALELRPLDDGMYPAANTTQYLDLAFRVNVGPSSDAAEIRHPDDPYDRVWWPYTQPEWTEISTTRTLVSPQDDVFHPPMAVMQTAATTANSSVMEFNWTFAETGLPNNEFYFNMFFAELQFSTSRTFDVYLNDRFFFRAPQDYLSIKYLYESEPLNASSAYRWALNSSGLSALPPFINGGELFRVVRLTQAATDDGDDDFLFDVNPRPFTNSSARKVFDVLPVPYGPYNLDAINAIKKEYRVEKNWMGDPCAPKQYHWDGLNCSYGTDSLRIITINMSSSALTGVISSSFADLTAIKYLDLSYNNLTGSIPDSLGTLSSLQVLDLTGNNLTGKIPDSLLKRSQGPWTFRYDGNPYLCIDGTSCGSKKNRTVLIVILCLVPVVLVLLFLVVFIVWRGRLRGLTRGTHAKQMLDCFPKLVRSQQNDLLKFENQRFTYKELEKITKKFTSVLGKGGFGSVFLGYLEDGTRVAVKMRSESSSQGTQEFIAEAQSLTKIHHKNLVSLVGYCTDRDHLALVYEFMSQGALQDHLTDKIKAGNASALSWRRRLQVAVEAAQGLEYLHKGCKPPLIHRDVKTANILLSESLEAKLADFGLSRAFNDPKDTHVSTRVVGTPGYLDPEYYFSFQLSEKSDVYSFGVVLLELITGRPAVFVRGKQSVSLVQWVRQRLANGDIEDIVDSRLQRQYDVNSIWKVADVALQCTEQAAHRRPTMTQVVLELNESLDLETAHRKSEFPSTGSRNTDAGTTSEVSWIAATSSTNEFGVEHIPSFTPSIR